MKRKWYLTIGVILAMALLTGCFFKRPDYKQETMKRAEETAESFIINNYQNIEHVKVKDVFRNESGGMSVTGIVNNTSSFHLNMDQFKFIVGSVETDENFPTLKDECQDRPCAY